MSSTLLYAYAVAKNAEHLGETVGGLVGVANGRVTLLHGMDPRLVVAAGPVPAPDFNKDALARHLEDLDWLEQTARAHHAVVAAMAADTTVLPLRLATVYLDEQRLRRVLDDHAQDFTERLDHLHAHTEWGVKVYLEAATAPPAPQVPAVPASLTPGRAYLERRRAVRDEHADALNSAQEAVEQIAAAALGCAVERARHSPQQGELADGTEGQNIVNDAYLVPDDQADAFRAVVLRAAGGFPGIRVDITGPWAPYSFTGAMGAEAQAGGSP